eukprot:GHVR01075441.1.p4 GENE.GHVR01075441.1~~GHVR01075441.1.p4  ORF type:complete len:118 (-),score=16.21 GHVR01075441.1:1381-1734(-)
MTNSRAKGKRGELQYAHWLCDNFGLNARRGQQYCGLAGNADVVGGFPNTHAECKWTEQLNLGKAFMQAVADCGDAIPYVVSKKNRQDILITVRASDLKGFCNAVVDTIIEQENPPSA